MRRVTDLSVFCLVLGEEIGCWVAKIRLCHLDRGRRKRIEETQSLLVGVVAYAYRGQRVGAEGISSSVHRGSHPETAVPLRPRTPFDGVLVMLCGHVLAVEGELQMPAGALQIGYSVVVCL